MECIMWKFRFVADKINANAENQCLCIYITLGAAETKRNYAPISSLKTIKY